MNNGENSGIMKFYNNDESMTDFISTDKQISTAGWMNGIIKDASLDTDYRKEFDNKGEIKEGQFNENDDLIDGIKWILKEDGTHDKFSVKRVKKNKDEEEDEEDSDGVEEVLTFICNEKVQ